MALILDLNNMFLEVLKTSYIYPDTSKVRFVKGLANYTKYVLNSLNNALNTYEHAFVVPMSQSL